MNTKESATIFFVVLNWNGKIDTIECVQSIETMNLSNTEIVIVDNGSSDDSFATFQQIFPHLVVLETERNLGYSGGNNFGIKHIMENFEPEYIVILNNDTIAKSNFISPLLEFSIKNNDNCILSSKIYYESIPNKIWSAGSVWNRDVCDFVNMGFNCLDDGKSYSEPIKTDFASGCLMFIPAHIIEEVGLLDERFFLNYEEIDWCYRAKKRGFDCYFVPDSQIFHKASVSFGGQGSPLQLYFETRNELLWASIHLPLTEFVNVFIRIFWTCFYIDIPKFGLQFFRTLFWNISARIRKNNRKSSDKIARARFLGLRDFLFRRFGDCPQEIRNPR